MARHRVEPSGSFSAARSCTRAESWRELSAASVVESNLAASTNALFHLGQMVWDDPEANVIVFRRWRSHQEILRRYQARSKRCVGDHDERLFAPNPNEKNAIQVRDGSAR